MSTHTTGPWRITGKATIRAGESWIADVHWQNREANARLIAAAPALLNALQLIAGTESTSLALEYVQGIARAAIANATRVAP